MNIRAYPPHAWTLSLSSSMVILALAVAPSIASAEQPPSPTIASQPHFTAPNGGTIYKRKGETREVKLTAIQTGGRYSVTEGHLSPGARVPPHFHKWHTEMFYVLSGEAKWTANGVTHLMKPGSLIYIPPGTVHSLTVVGDQPFHTLLISTPGGHEYEIQRQQSRTPEQKKDPAYGKKLRKLNDFNLAIPEK